MQPAPTRALLPRAWYSASLASFLTNDITTIVGGLTIGSNFAITPEQRDAWVVQIGCLKAALGGVSGLVHLEFDIPRMGHRADAVIVSGPALLVIEFKSGQHFTLRDTDQVLDYALDLKHFHKASHALPIVPILVVADAQTQAAPTIATGADDVYVPLCVAGPDLGHALAAALGAIKGASIDAAAWLRAPYHPTPTIIEAARALYANHSVAEIAASEAAADDLDRTSQRLKAIAADAFSAKRKAICFVTGVPGAGKTLIGLDAATQRSATDDTHAVFLSGNGPLVAVLRAALGRDERERTKRQRITGASPPAVHPRQTIKSFIQNIHHFRDEALKDERAPAEHVVVFDEAQRAWTLNETASFMRRKKGQPDFNQSEPEFLISYMDRHSDWAVIVCLVGGGQEINRGEAGIGAWLEAVTARFSGWEVHISPQLGDSEYAAGGALAAMGGRPRLHFDESLHLAVSVRSFRAENLSRFVKLLLDCEPVAARAEFEQLRQRYPMAVTRDLALAKRWVREHARGSERCGLLATSKAMRLKPHAIDVRVDVNPVHWFLNGPDDPRSSYYLEDAATEFDVQGLEVDWSCVTWDGDLRYQSGAWSFHNFRGAKWERIKNNWNQAYARNAYRVLLTRARQGMAIFVPPGEVEDSTRPPQYYDRTFEYLASLGLPVLG